VCAGRTEDEIAAAETGVRWLLAFYGSTPAYRLVLDHLGCGELQPELNRLSKEGRWDEMAGLVDDDLIEAITLRGTPADVGRQIHERYDGLADRVALTFPYAPPPDLLGEIVDATRT